MGKAEKAAPAAASQDKDDGGAYARTLSLSLVASRRETFFGHPQVTSRNEPPPQRMARRCPSSLSA